jgi:hypothetical protein
MLYTVLCYNSEAEVAAWSKEKDDATMAKLSAVGKKLKDEGKLHFSARLMYTTTAVTLRPGRDPLPIVDGPFAETKEQLLGFYIIECETLEEAIEAGRQLAGPRESGSLEIRPMRSVHEGVGL